MSTIQWRRFAFFDKEIISECIVQQNDDENQNGILIKKYYY